MRKPVINCLIILLITIFSRDNFAQQRLLNKMKDKVEDKMIEKIFDENKDEEKKQSQQTMDTRESSVKNIKGEGLSSSIPDVNANIDDASSSFEKGEYSDARYSIRQAIQGIELEMGVEVLKLLPEEVDGLPAQKDEDQITSTGVGFVGLAIEREYKKGNQEMKVIIANNSAWITAINMYLGTTGYATTSEEEQYKEIKFQDYRGIIEYDEDSGYKLSVPFGQSSILVMQGINFDNEQKFMSACDKIKINDIKSKLGEQ